MLRFGIKDATSGFRAFKAATIQAASTSTMSRPRVTASRSRWRGKVFLDGGRITEIPITFVERVAGRLQDVAEDRRSKLLLGVTKWGFRDRFGKNGDAR